MGDIDENTIVVNAPQRHATVVVQASLVEGFDLTATEAKWKNRLALSKAVGGGIQDQIFDGTKICCRTVRPWRLPLGLSRGASQLESRSV